MRKEADLLRSVDKMPPDEELTLLTYFGIYVNDNFPLMIRMKASTICLELLNS
jgi:hypothetical protein